MVFGKSIDNIVLLLGVGMLLWRFDFRQVNGLPGGIALTQTVVKLLKAVTTQNVLDPKNENTVLEKEVLLTLENVAQSRKTRLNEVSLVQNVLVPEAGEMPGPSAGKVKSSLVDAFSAEINSVLNQAKNKF